VSARPGGECKDRAVVDGAVVGVRGEVSRGAEGEAAECCCRGEVCAECEEEGQDIGQAVEDGGQLISIKKGIAPGVLEWRVT
jgi:hypothetical protein